MYIRFLVHSSPSDAACPIKKWCTLRTQMCSVSIAKDTESVTLLEGTDSMRLGGSTSKMSQDSEVQGMVEPF